MPQPKIEILINLTELASQVHALVWENDHTAALKLVIDTLPECFPFRSMIDMIWKTHQREGHMSRENAANRDKVKGWTFDTLREKCPDVAELLANCF